MSQSDEHENTDAQNPSDQTSTFDPATEKSQRKELKRAKRQSFAGKIRTFCVGLVIGGAIVFGAIIATVGFSTVFHSADNPSEINVFELEKKIEESSDLTITKVQYANLAYEKDSKSIPTPLGGEATLPFTENSKLIAYKGTIGLGFDVSTIEPKVNPETKTITIALPAIEILYDEFDNENSESYTVTDDVFSEKDDFNSDNELIGRLKATEESSVRNDESTLSEARKNAENVIRNIVSGWDATAGYEIIFE